MAPKYKLIYFSIRGLAETSRFLLSYGGIEFEDVRIEEEDWPQYKDKTPFGVLPLLEYDGKVVGQSIAIARYLAKEVKLAGNDDWENLEVDSVVDTITDLRLKIVPIFYENNEEKKKALVETARRETLPYYLSRLEAIAQKKKGYIAVGRLTWADFYFATMSLVFDIVMEKDTLAGYPNLKSVVENVHALPAIKKWIASRPKTHFRYIVCLYK